MKKALIVITAFVLAVTLLSACGQGVKVTEKEQTVSLDTTRLNGTLDYHGLKFNISDKWDRVDGDNDIINFYSEDNTAFIMFYNQKIVGSIMNKANQTGFVEGYLSNMVDPELLSKDTIQFAGGPELFQFVNTGTQNGMKIRSTMTCMDGSNTMVGVALIECTDLEQTEGFAEEYDMMIQNCTK